MILKLLYTIVIGAILMSAAAIYRNEYRMRDAEREITRIQEQIAQEQAYRELLKAEWANLTNPARIESLVKYHLPDLKPFRPDQLTTLDGLVSRLPKEKSQAQPAPGDDPIGDMLKVLQ